MAILAIDFDRTIHDTDNPVPGRKMGPPMPGAVSGLRALKALGHDIVVFTLRAHTPAGANSVWDWCRYWEVPCDSVTVTKPDADWFIDDKAIRFTTWPEVMEAIL